MLFELWHEVDNLLNNDRADLTFKSVPDATTWLSLSHAYSYSGRKITPSLGYVTLRGERKSEKQGEQKVNSLSENV
jgi:hypothetical protein